MHIPPTGGICFIYSVYILEMNITCVKEVLGSGSYYGVETWLEVGERRQSG
jgi:hypothetical protein